MRVEIVHNKSVKMASIKDGECFSFYEDDDRIYMVVSGHNVPWMLNPKGDLIRCLIRLSDGKIESHFSPNSEVYPRKFKCVEYGDA